MQQGKGGLRSAALVWSANQTPEGSASLCLVAGGCRRKGQVLLQGAAKPQGRQKGNKKGRGSRRVRALRRSS